MKEKITVAGVEHDVIARQPATLPHPNPVHEGKLVRFKSVNEVLLDDDSRVYECVYPDVDCNFVAPNGRAVVAHQSTHNPNSHTTDYEDETIRLLLRTAKVEMRDRGIRGYAERTAAILNKMGYKQLSGDPFSASSVSSLYRRWHEKIQVRVPNGAELARKRGREDRANASARRGRSHGGGATLHDTVDALIPRVTNLKSDVITALDGVLEQLHEVRRQIDDVKVDPELVSKARRWDDFQKLMNGKPGK